MTEYQKLVATIASELWVRAYGADPRTLFGVKVEDDPNGGLPIVHLGEWAVEMAKRIVELSAETKV